MPNEYVEQATETKNDDPVNTVIVKHANPLQKKLYGQIWFHKIYILTIISLRPSGVYMRQ